MGGCIGLVPLAVFFGACLIVISGRYEVGEGRAVWLGFLTWAIVIVPLMLASMAVFLAFGNR